MGHRAFVFFLLLVSTMKYFTWKPKQWQREPFVLRKEINTAETGKVSRNIWFSQAMGCWITAPKCQTVLGLLKTVLQKNQNCNKSVWLRAARHLFHAHADSSNPLQAVTFRLSQLAQHLILCLHQLFTIPCLFHPVNI